jgi:hypothetical protein
MIREIRLCDICLTGPKPRDTNATVTRTFSDTDGKYEIDLCERDDKAMVKTLTPYIESGRRVPKYTSNGRVVPTRDRGLSRDIRAWAKAEQIPLNEKGRIPRKIVARYNAAVG